MTAVITTLVLSNFCFSLTEVSNVQAAPVKDKASQYVDWGGINQEALIQYLHKTGKIKQNATAAEVEKAVKDYATRGQNPYPNTDGINTSSSFGKKVLTQRTKILQKTAKKVHSFKGKETNSIKKHTDRAVVALIQFPDAAHNQIPYQGDSSFWSKDFNQTHYEQLLFGKTGFLMDNGKKLITANQYYQQQSVGFWSLAGTVTPWINAQNNAAYYGGHFTTPDYTLNDAKPAELVKETLNQVGKQIAGQEAIYDQRDPYDLDNDGNVMESDGLLDSLFIVHSGKGEEAGGGDNAIWSHRSVIGPEPVAIPGTKLKAFDYIIQPEDGATGVFVHEYGHNLGLPDEYDTGYTGTGSPVEAWSLMSYGSWTGTIPGTEPTGFSPWAKLFFSELYGGTWPVPTVVDQASLTTSRQIALKEAVANTSKDKIIKVNLPNRIVQPPLQPLGKKSYYSTKGNMLNTKLTSPEIDLTNVQQAELSFDTWYSIEAGYDFAYVQIYVDGASKPEQILSLTGSNKEWVNKKLDLSKYAGHKIKVEFNYVTDIGLAEEGFYVDNIQVNADGKTVLHDDVETTGLFALNEFQLFDGSAQDYPSYYLVEWRTHNGVDNGLAHLRRNNSIMSYDAGMLVWYYDGRYGEDNMTGLHPGEGFLGVVDAHQQGHFWSDGKVGTTRYQLNDAAFNIEATSPMDVVYPNMTMKYDSQPGISAFDDNSDYSSPFNPAGGKLLPKVGLKMKITKVSEDKTKVWIQLSK